jgi:hypothetical protein
MLRLSCYGVFVSALCALQAGCCCRCGVPFFAAPPRPQIVFNVDPPAIQAPPPDNPFQPPNNPPPNNPFATKQYVYKQTTGQLMLNNEIIGAGYSGKGQGRNNPATENQKNVGPIPAGSYKIMGKRVDGQTGATIVDTLPSGHNAAGRWPGTERFAIRGDTNPPGMGPAGDIVVPRQVLDKIDPNGFPDLKVIQ